VKHQSVILKRGSSESRFSPIVYAIRTAHAQAGVPLAKPNEIPEGHAFAERLIGGKLVSPETLARVHETTGVGVFLARENGQLTGVAAIILLNEAGRAAVEANAFDSLDPAPAHLLGPGEKPAAIYGWGVATTNHEATERFLHAGRLNRALLLPLPVVTKPVTPAGLRLIERLGFTPVAGSTSGLFWNDPATRKPAAAAA
jgi:hypothetical protein